MPDDVRATPSPVTAVPRRMRLVCGTVAAVVVVVMVVVGLLLTSSSTGTVSFQTADQVALIVLGVLLGAGILLLGRSRVDADAEGVRVRNILATHRLPWDLVRAVRFEGGSAWASLALANGDELSVLALQAADKGRAADAVEGLRALLAASRGTPPPTVPLLYDD